MASLLLVGPGRAGMSVALAAREAGHSVVGVLARSGASDAAQKLGAISLDWESDSLPSVDMLIVAVSDGAIRSVAQVLAGRVTASVAVHLSGATPISVLAGLGLPHGSLHPLQSLPDPDIGMHSLVGAGMAVTGSSPEVVEILTQFAHSIGCRPFPLSDHSKVTYHAAASAASNFVTTVLALSDDLFRAAGVDPALAQTLTQAAVRNAYTIGPKAALTGPVARGDTDTVQAQIEAAYDVSEQVGATFSALVEATQTLVESEVVDGNS